MMNEMSTITKYTEQLNTATRIQINGEPMPLTLAHHRSNTVFMLDIQYMIITNAA